MCDKVLHSTPRLIYVVLWQAWIMDAWHAGRGSYPRQLELSSDQPKVIEELEFISMMDLQTDRVHTLPNRNGIWTAMLPLHQILSEVMQLNSSLAISSSRSPEMIIRARQLDRTTPEVAPRDYRHICTTIRLIWHDMTNSDLEGRFWSCTLFTITLLSCSSFTR